jgi:hypothetical protein
MGKEVIKMGGNIVSAETLQRLYGRFGRFLFYVSEEAVQAQAEKQVGRKLTEDELLSVATGFEWGLGDPLYDVMTVAIDESVLISKGKQKLELHPCDSCKTITCFESKDENSPREYDVCNSCGGKFCPNCINWCKDIPLCNDCFGERR